ncbi:MAG TPA: hypothetical protein VIT92_00970, partial [Burkholderiaceae bacterium]
MSYAATLLLAAAVAPAPALAANAVLKPSALVHGARYTLADVATVSAATPAQAAELAAIDLGPAPRAGAMAVVTRAQLQRTLRQRGALDLSLSGAERVTVDTVAQPYPAERLVDAARAHLAALLGSGDARV